LTDFLKGCIVLSVKGTKQLAKGKRKACNARKKVKVMKWDNEDLKKVNDYKAKIEKVRFDFDEEVGTDDFTQAFFEYAFTNEREFLTFLAHELYSFLWEKYKENYLDCDGDIRVDWFCMDVDHLING
jgi:hypothetical protein